MEKLNPYSKLRFIPFSFLNYKYIQKFGSLSYIKQLELICIICACEPECNIIHL